MTDKCEHKFIYLRAEKSVTEGAFNSCWKRDDVFFCEKCLEERRKHTEENSRNAPRWWRYE